MESEKGELEDQEVTVEVLPQTVTEIIYLQDSDLCYTTEEDSEIKSTESYEIGSVDFTRLGSKSLVLDASQSFVLLSSDTDVINGNALYLSDGELNQNYLEHTEEINSGIGEFICTLCNYKCRSLSSLSAHRLIHDDQFIRCHYNCVVCGLQFDKAQSLSHHFRTTHEISKYVCNICNCACSHEWALLQHLKIHEPKKFSCDSCNAIYDSAVKLINHKKTHSTTLLYACNKCDASFETTSEVSHHLRTMHERVKLPMRVVTSKIKSSFSDSICKENVSIDSSNEEKQRETNISKRRRTR